MKNSKTMYAIAKAVALNKGVKTFESERGNIASGYALTREELEHVYAREGFTSKKTISRHLESWKSIHWIIEVPFGENKDWVYFFTFDDSDTNERLIHHSIIKRFPDCQDNYGVMMR